MASGMDYHYGVKAMWHVAVIGSFFLTAAARAVAQDWVTVPFAGPDRTHLTYFASAPVDGEVKLEAQDPGGGTRQLDFGSGTIQGTLLDTDLAVGNIRYAVMKRGPDPATGEMGAWYQSFITEAVAVDGVSAGGRLLFDEELENVRIRGVFVPADFTLTLSGSLTAPTNDTTAIELYGSLVLDGAITLLPHVRGGEMDDIPFRVDLATPTSLAGVSGGVFLLNAAGSSLNACSGIRIVPSFGGTLISVTNAVVELRELPEGTTLEISDSDCSSGVTAGGGYLYDRQCIDGTLILDGVVWNGPFEARGAADVSATDCDFRGDVSVQNDEGSTDDVVFSATRCRFTSYGTSRPGSGSVRLSQCLFSAQAGAYGGAAEFEDCEFGGGFRLQNRSATVITRSRFLTALIFANDYPEYDTDIPRWHEANDPSPTIQGNAFMDDVALRYEHLTGVASPSVPITIGANFYGSPAGWYNDVSGLERGFLPDSYRARVLGNSSAAPVFAIATPLTQSPLAAVRQDTRVFPRFWLNGHIAGQNTINHQNGTLDNTASHILIKGRETLLSVDLSCTEEALSGVRVYAEWDGKQIEAERAVSRVRRDPAQFPRNDIRYARSTFSFILPPVQDATMPVVVRLDASGVAGFDPDAYPEEDAALLAGTVTFKDPPSRPLRIWVFPVEVSGLTGSWGTGSAAATVETLGREIPNQLAIPADKLRVVQKPVLSVWSPTTFITSLGLLNRVSAQLAFGRWVVSGLDQAPDFIVAVMPHGLITDGAEGASFVGRRRVLFVDELRARAALHELGHGVGLCTSKEQYDAYPPEGLPVERATVFRNAEAGSVNRIQHQPSSSSTWFDSNMIVYDTMGAGDPSAPLVVTVAAFDDWVRENLDVPAPTGVQTLQAVDLSDPSPLDIPPGMRRILLSGATDYYYAFKPNTLQIFDVTRLDGEARPPNSGSVYTFAAYDADGTQIFSQGFVPASEDPEWVGTFDVPAATAACRVIKSSDSSTAIAVTASGLQSVALLAPAASGTLGDTLAAHWSVAFTNTPAPGQVRHLLFWRTDPAQPWTLLAGPTVATNVLTLTTALPETSTLALRLVTSDGVESVEHIVDGITVTPRAPRVTIRAPLGGAVSQSNAVWRLSAEVTEFPPQTAGDGLWTSSLQGELGTGREIDTLLDAGDHLLRYETGTPGGLTNHAEVSVSVLDAPDALPLGFEETDLTLHHQAADPTGLIPAYMLAGVTNRFVLRLRTGGVGGTSRLRLYLQKPVGGEVLAATHSVTNEPFSEQFIALDCHADETGTYTVRAILDEVDPADPDLSDNERTWTFSTVTPTITLNRTPLGGGTVAGAGTYLYGATVTVGATPNPGFVFTKWSQTAGGAAISTEPEFSFTATEDRTLWANFQSLPVITVQASPVDGGTVSGAGTYAPGDTVTVVATPNSGYAFVNWTEFGYEVSADATYSFSAAQNRTLTANFQFTAGQTYVVSLGYWPLEGGSVAGNGTYASGATATVTATPNDGYVFVNWTEWSSVEWDFVEVSTNAVFAFVVSGDRNLRANFALPPLTGDRTIAEALDTSAFSFSTGGSGPWVGLALPSAVRDADAARSGVTADDTTSWLQATVTGPGTFTFWWRASSEEYWDQGFFLIDGDEAAVIDGETGWMAVTNELAAGIHTLRWEYRKDSGWGEGDDCIWLDDVQFASSGGGTATASTPVAVPHAWLDGFTALLAASGGDYEDAAWDDYDSDGHATWQEYVAGSDPEDENSILRAGLSLEDGAPRLSWQPDLGGQRAYTIEGKAELGDAVWGATNSATRFFRIRVALP